MENKKEWSEDMKIKNSENTPIATIVIDMLKKNIRTLYVWLIVVLVLGIISTVDSFYQRQIIQNMIKECYSNHSVEENE